MAEVFAYECPNCRFAVTSDWSNSVYVLDDKGDWVVCPHPGDFASAAELLGITTGELGDALGRRKAVLAAALSAKSTARDHWVDEQVATRLKFTTGGCCFQCHTHAEVDLALPSRHCDACGSSEVYTPCESVGRPCPNCHQATIVQVGTGIHF